MSLSRDAKQHGAMAPTSNLCNSLLRNGRPVDCTRLSPRIVTVTCLTLALALATVAVIVRVTPLGTVGVPPLLLLLSFLAVVVYFMYGFYHYFASSEITKCRLLK